MKKIKVNADLYVGNDKLATTSEVNNIINDAVTSGPKGDKGEQGPAGADGKSLEFNWDGTQLGIRKEGESNYSYVDLKGQDGSSLSDEELRNIASTAINQAIEDGKISNYDDTEIREALLDTQVTPLSLAGLTYNQYWLTKLPQGNHVSSSARSFIIDLSSYIGCTLKMKFDVIGTDGSVLKYAYVIADASDNILHKDGEPDFVAKSVDTEIVIPNGAKTLYIGTDVNNMASAVISFSKNVNRMESLSSRVAMMETVVKPTELTVSMQNDCVEAYLKNVSYACNDYSVSDIENYNASTSYRKDQPQSLELHVNGAKSFVIADNPKYNNAKTYTAVDGSVSISNLLPKRYYCKAMDGTSLLQAYTVNVVGTRRMIKCDSIYNVRDIGGLVGVDGRKVRYGLLYRGSELDTSKQPNLSSEEIAMMKELGIKAEIDLRYDGTDGTTDEDILGHSVLGSDVEYFHINGYPYGSFDKGNTVFVTIVRKIVEFLSVGKPVYIHCVGGADRTGFMCTALEGLLGVNENDLAKDYELTSFSKYGVRKRSDASGNYHYRTRLERIKGETGDTLADKWLAHFAAQGLTEDDVKALRNLMLE